MRQLTVGAIAVISLTQVTVAATALAESRRLNYFDKVFFSGNDVYEWCHGERPMALAYTAALADSASHSIYVSELLRDESRENALTVNRVPAAAATT
jgi:hypothetical protein